MFKGLHLESNEPKALLKLCEARMLPWSEHLDEIRVPTYYATRRHSCK
jgi:hypothetical protein